MKPCFCFFAFFRRITDVFPDPLFLFYCLIFRAKGIILIDGRISSASLPHSNQHFRYRHQEKKGEKIIQDPRARRHLRRDRDFDRARLHILLQDKRFLPFALRRRRDRPDADRDGE